MKQISFLSVVLFFSFLFHQAAAQTTITLQPGPSNGKDATVVSKGSDNNQGDREGLTASTWTYNEELMLKRFYVAFDLSSIPENTIVTDAKLSLFFNSTDPYGDYHIGENDLYIQRVISEWDELTIVWDNQPSTTTEHQVELPPSVDSLQDYLDINVTDLVIDMVDPANDNNGFMFRMMDEINFYKGVIFASSNHIDAALHPKLVITYLPDSVNCVTLKPNADNGKDATVTNRGSGNNQGDRESLVSATWTYNGDLMHIRNYLAFDLLSIPENAIITDARLSLFYNPTDPYESWDYHTGENDLYIQRVTSEWDEHTIVWNNQPSSTTENQVELPPSIDSTQDYLDIDVTNLVIDMVDPAIGNNGFMFRMVDEFNYYKGVIFASSDHADSSLHPELKVCFNLYTSDSEPPKETFDFKLYPNPANQTITIKLGFNIDISMEIINAHGYTVRKISSINQTETIDISSLPGGTYIIRLFNKDIVLVKKLVIK